MLEYVFPPPIFAIGILAEVHPTANSYFFAGASSSSSVN